MKKQKLNFKISDYKAMQHDANHWAGIKFTIKQIKDVLTKAPKEAQYMWDDFEAVGHPSGKYGMDTAVRDIWFSAIGMAFTGRDWPINAEGEESSKKFFTDLSNGLKKSGY